MNKLMFIFFSLLFGFYTNANNSQIGSIQFISGSSELGHVHVQFDISWKNSWRDSKNWDAVRIYIKYNDGTGWQHSELNLVDGNTDGHSATVGSIINTPSDGRVVFVCKSIEESGTSMFTNLKLRWNYQNDGISSFDDMQVKVLGVKAVYAPEGSFWLGDSGTIDIHGHFESGTSGTRFQVNSQGSIILGGGVLGCLGNNNRQDMTNNVDFVPPPYNTVSIDDFSDTISQTLPVDFPKGYIGFYCMKYELMQNQYVDFLNMLTSTHATSRYGANSHSVDEASVRHNIIGKHPNTTG